MSELGEKIVEEMFLMFTDIVDTSQKFILIERQKEWILNLLEVARIHKLSVELIMKKKEIQNDTINS
jgi:hypothetical protein